MEVKFFDLSRHFQTLESELVDGMRDVCRTSQFILGRPVQLFEEAFAAFLEVPSSVGVSNGTEALHLAFRAVGIGPGDEVLVPAHTFIATPFGVSHAGATPVPVDIDPKTFLMDISLAEKALTKKTKAVCPVHLYGRACDMDAWRSFADANKLVLIEDAAQAHGARWKGKRVGTFGAAGCFSFYPGKNLGAYGDGGAVVTMDPSIEQKIRALRNYGSPTKYHHPELGFNSRLDGLQASILKVKLKYLEEWNKKRRELAKLYCEKLSHVSSIILPEIPLEESEHVFHLFVIRVPNRRDELVQGLKVRGVETVIHYPIPFHLQGAYTNLGYKKGAFPISETICEEVISLPLYPELTFDEVTYTVKCVTELCS